jgi:SpoVK/Ycf46/Vps4 family AAA+-type ATPase
MIKTLRSRTFKKASASLSKNKRTGVSNNVLAQGEKQKEHSPAPLEEIEFSLKPLTFAQQRALQFVKNFIQNFKEDIEDNDIFRPLNRAIALEDACGIFLNHFSTDELILSRLIDADNDDDDDPFSAGGRIEHMDDCRELFGFVWRRPFLRAKVAKVICIIAERYEQPEAAAFLPNDFVETRFEEIKKTLSLSDFEVDVLTLTYIKERDYFDFPECRYEDRFYNYLKYFSKCLNCPESTLLKTLGKRERLRRYGCLSCGASIILPPELNMFLDGLSDKPLISRYYRKAEQETLPWNFFDSVVKEHGDILKKIISSRKSEQGINILLHGTPGTGKTSFAYALAKELGLNAYTVAESSKSRRNMSANATFRFGALQFTSERIETDKSLIVVDEADDMLAGGNSYSGDSSEDGGDEEEASTGGRTGKGLLNHVLDSTKGVVIWLANTRSDELDASNRRRFDYAIEFENFTAKQRLKIWRNIVAKRELGSLYNDALLEELAKRFSINAGTISIVLKNIANINPPAGDVRELTIKFLNQHCKLLGVKCDVNDTFAPAKDYSLEGLNIKTNRLSLERIVDSVRRFQKTLGDDVAGTSPDRPRMNILLHGAPGSGKTEFVKFLAKELNTKIVKKMGSDLKNCFVGMTEKNIAKAFREAEEEKAILFMDEFDGMLQTREKAERSWETSQVNEILDKMENFNGVFIAATNFAENLDPAALRRFTFKVEFDFLDNAGKRHFFKNFFNSELTEHEGFRLDEIEHLTPGDFRTARQSLYYLGDDVTNEERLDVLEKESEQKERSGFVRKERRAGF